jgi:NAD(P)-dependent dehydrogenase (short-subunit alcohol dehydrogenase family)
MTALDNQLLAQHDAAGSPRAAVVLGARNLGGAIARDLLAHGVRVASVARTAADLDRLRGDGAVTLSADAADADQLGRGLARAAEAIGPVDLIVDAVSAARPPGDGSGFGGGPLASATLAGFDAWVMSVTRQAFVTLQAGIRALSARGGVLVEIVGAPARRADSGRGLIAAGSAATRALTHAAAQEAREQGVHVALLIVDGIIESPKTVQMTQGLPTEALVREQEVAAAVRYLAGQGTRGMTHELVITPGGARWLP